MYKISFINFLKFEKRYSSYTIIAYDKEIQDFENFLTLENVSFEDVDHKLLRYYFSTLREKGKEPVSVNRAISTMKSYYKFMLREKLISKNPMRLIQTMKIGKKLPVVIDRQKMDHLLDNIMIDDAVEQSFEDLRDFLIMELLYGTGIRSGELLQIKDRDIDFFNKKLLILGKRNKMRFVPLHDTLVEELKKYIEKKKEQDWENISDNLIVTKEGKAAYPKLIYRVVNKYLTMVTTQKKKSPHVLRHSFATILLDNGADLNAIKELLGHAGLAATQIYTHNSAERLKTIYKQAHPKA